MEIRRFVEGEEKSLSTLIRRDLQEVNTEDPIEENQWLFNHYTPEYIKTAAKTDHTYTIVENGIPIATGNVKMLDDGSAEICGCFVAPEYIGKGVGKLLFDTLEADEYCKKATRIWLTTSVMARGFYEKRGYQYVYGYLGKNPDGLVEMELPKK